MKHFRAGNGSTGTFDGKPVDIHLFATRHGGAPFWITGQREDGLIDVTYLFSGFQTAVGQYHIEPFKGFNEEGRGMLADLRGEAAIRAARYLNCVQGATPSAIHKLMRGAYPDPKATMEDTMAQQLYETKDHRFGTFLQKNSLGQLVLEMKGENGKVEAFDKDALTEVLPFTVQIEGQHYEAKVGALAEGDVLLAGEYIARVRAVNTKKRTNSGPIPEGWVKVLTEEIKR